MNVVEVLDSVASVVAAEDSVVQVIVIGRDAAATARALALVNRVAGRFEDGLEFETNAWTFGMLRLTPIQKLAVTRAAAADIVIVAGIPEEEPPAELKHCLDEATRQRGPRTRAVIALTNRPGDLVTPRLCQYLHTLCEARPDDTFVCSKSVPADESDAALDWAAAPTGVSSTVIQSVVRHPLAEHHFLIRCQAGIAAI